MGPKRWRLGIRPQLTIIVLLAAVLSTVGTLLVTNFAVRSYVENQARDQEREHAKIAKLVLETNFGENISIASNGNMVVDSPGANGSFQTYDANAPYGKYSLNGDADYVDLVQQLITGMVSVYQCTDKDGNALVDASGQPVCKRIATTFRIPLRAGESQSMAARAVDKDIYAKSTAYPLEPIAMQKMGLEISSSNSKQWSNTAQEWPASGSDPVPVVTISGTTYIADYKPITNPQGQIIGVLFVGVPYDAVTSVVANTTIELVIIGTLIMIAGVIIAIIVASTIVGTLQRAARQVSTASERFGAIAAQQSSGSTQQVWAINAINQALQNLSETATDISKRTDQLAQMGNQVLQRRSEISPTQIDSIIAYITRSVRDISGSSRQQASTYERMTGAMQAVMEVAEQVAGDSQQTSENAERLETVVQQLRQLVGVNRRALMAASPAAQTAAQGNGQAAEVGVAARQGTVQAVRPARAGKSDRQLRSARELAGAGAYSGMSGQLAGGHQGMRAGSESHLGVRSGGLGGPGMAQPGGGGPWSGPQAPQGNWLMPTPNAGANFPGRMPMPDFPAPSPFGQPPNDPMAGAAPSGRWNVGSPNSGPGAWGAPGPNSGPGGWGGGPAPSSGQPPFDASALTGTSGDRWGRGLPPIDGVPEAGDAGTDAAFRWPRRE
ncbi:MAG TPA: cache domain-containing protein [Ktedonobacterales bacterium]